jgi:hypothetical protein
MTARVKMRKTQIEHLFSALPPIADLRLGPCPRSSSSARLLSLRRGSKAKSCDGCHCVKVWRVSLYTHPKHRRKMMSARRASNEKMRELPDDDNRANLGALKRGRTRQREGSRDGLLGTHLRHPPIGGDGSLASTGLTTHEAARLQTAQYTGTVEHEPEIPPRWPYLPSTGRLVAGYRRAKCDQSL